MVDYDPFSEEVMRDPMPIYRRLRDEARICLEETLKAIPEYSLDLEHAERLVTDFAQGYPKFPVTF